MTQAARRVLARAGPQRGRAALAGTERLRARGEARTKELWMASKLATVSGEASGTTSGCSKGGDSRNHGLELAERAEAGACASWSTAVLVSVAR